MIRGVLLDIAGVLHNGGVAIAGAAEAVSHLREAALPIRFVSNTTRSTKADVIAQLGSLGLPVRSDELYTPAQAALAWLDEHDATAHLLVHPDLESDFRSVREGANMAVVVGDAGDAFDYASLNGAFRLLVGGAELLALAPNRSFRDADGGLSLDAGPFVAALEFASQQKAIVLGKPSHAFFQSALTDMDCKETEAVMVGDDAETDIAGALAAGIGSGLLVRTGKYRPGDEKRFKPYPTEVVENISEAVDWILQKRS